MLIGGSSNPIDPRASFTYVNAKYIDSSGGLIALGLFGKPCRVEAYILSFKRLYSRGLVRRPFGRYFGRKFQQGPFEDFLKRDFPPTELLFGGSQAPYGQGHRPKVAVTTMMTGSREVTVLGNYNRWEDDAIGQQTSG